MNKEEHNTAVVILALVGFLVAYVLGGVVAGVIVAVIVLLGWRS